MSASAACTLGLVITSQSKATYTRRPPFHAMSWNSGSAVLPPRVLVPRQFHTPSSATQHSPADTAASAFLTPSVIHSGTSGSPSWPRMRGGTSSTMRAAARRLVLDRLPAGLARLVRPVLPQRDGAGRVVHRDQQAGRALLIVLEPGRAEPCLGVGRDVAALPRDLGRDGRRGQQLLMLRQEAQGVVRHGSPPRVTMAVAFGAGWRRMLLERSGVVSGPLRLSGGIGAGRVGQDRGDAEPLLGGERRRRGDQLADVGARPWRISGTAVPADLLGWRAAADTGRRGVLRSRWGAVDTLSVPGICEGRTRCHGRVPAQPRAGPRGITAADSLDARVRRCRGSGPVSRRPSRSAPASLRRWCAARTRSAGRPARTSSAGRAATSRAGAARARCGRTRSTGRCPSGRALAAAALAGEHGHHPRAQADRDGGVMPFSIDLDALSGLAEACGPAARASTRADRCPRLPCAGGCPTR